MPKSLVILLGFALVLLFSSAGVGEEQDRDDTRKYVEQYVSKLRFGMSQDELVLAVRDARTEFAAQFFASRLLHAESINTEPRSHGHAILVLRAAEAESELRRYEGLLSRAATPAAATVFERKRAELFEDAMRLVEELFAMERSDSDR